ncbi:MAG: cation-translocating P-type ATPase C-terminal domain-containing protein, partial [Planctomycetota bacterium]
SQMGNVLAIRSARDSLFQIGLLSNKLLLAAVCLTFVMQMAVVYTPQLQTVFKTVALTPAELGACILLSTLLFWAIEVKKLVHRVRAA